MIDGGRSARTFSAVGLVALSRAVQLDDTSTNTNMDMDNNMDTQLHAQCKSGLSAYVSEGSFLTSLLVKSCADAIQQPQSARCSDARIRVMRIYGWTMKHDRQARIS
jgi:hypothetical protein